MTFAFAINKSKKDILLYFYWVGEGSKLMMVAVAEVWMLWLEWLCLWSCTHGIYRLGGLHSSCDAGHDNRTLAENQVQNSLGLKDLGG